MIFDATKVPVASDRSLWEKGKYRVIIATSEQKTAKSGKGTVVILGLKSLESSTQGNLSHTINFKHDNATTEQIGQKELSSICHAVKILQPEAWTQLHGHPFMVEVDQEFVPEKPEKKDDKGQAIGKTYNRVVGYFNEDGSSIVGSGGNGAAPAPKEELPEWARPATAPAPAAPATPPIGEPPWKAKTTSASATPPLPTPPAPPVPEKLYHVAYKNATLEGGPKTPTVIKALPDINFADPSFMVCDAHDGGGWVAGSTIL